MRLTRNQQPQDESTTNGGDHTGHVPYNFDEDGVATQDNSSADSEDNVMEQVEKGKTEAIAKRETKIVFGMRVFVMGVLVASTVMLAYFVHHYLLVFQRISLRIVGISFSVWNV